jgi:hypothetical protein
MDKLTNRARTIKNIVAISILLAASNSYGPLYSMHFTKIKMVELEDSLLVDRDGNRYSVKKMIDNNLWMTANLKVNIPDSYCYENIKENCDQYGRLYTWKSAQEGCTCWEKDGDFQPMMNGNNWQSIMVLQKIRLTTGKELSKPCFMEVAPGLMRYSVVIVPLMASTSAWMHMASIGLQQKTTAVQPGCTTLEQAANFLIATMIMKSQAQCPYVV